MKNSALILLLILMLGNRSLSQQVSSRQMLLTLKNAKNDKDKITTLLELADYYCHYNLDSALLFAKKAEAIIQEVGESRPNIKLYPILGNIYLLSGQNEKALEYKYKAFKEAEKIGDTLALINSADALGQFYGYTLNNAERAVFYANTAISLAEKQHNEDLVFDLLGGLSNYYFNNRIYNKSLEIINRQLAIAKKQNSDGIIGMLLCGTGDIYRAQGDNEKCISYYQQGLKLIEAECARDSSGLSMLASQYGNNSLALTNLKKFPEAIANINRAIAIYRRTGEDAELINSYGRLVDIYITLGSWKKALELNNICIAYYSKLGYTKSFADQLKIGAVINAGLGNYKAAYSQLDSFQQIKGTLQNAESRNKMAALEASVLTEKKQSQIDLLNKEKEHQGVIRNLLLAGLIMLLIVAIIIFRSWRQKQVANKLLEEKNKIIEEQKMAVEEKNKEITDSIVYATRIQNAILPSLDSFQLLFPSSFILYKPKDIVAGDFYWLEVLGDTVLFAACDCTGHGVPGAMVSFICHNALNRAVLEFGLLQPAAILTKAAEIVTHNFSKGGDELRDGMDISLCAYNGKHNTLQWAGAQNPLWIINPEGATEIKGDRLSIGRNHKEAGFTNHEVTLNPNDTLYIFTDGFADQFGGPDSKKFQKKRFKELLMHIQTLPFAQQHSQLESFLNTYKGDTEQTDDILVIGVKVG